MDRLWTIGHSTRTVSEIAALLESHGVKRVVDVRRFPRGKRQPHLSRENLERALPAVGIGYAWMGEQLGGFRAGGYEAFTQTTEFGAGIEQLERIAREASTAVMCAEIVWFRCHRRFIARAMAARGWRVTHIVGDGKTYDEEPTML
jgi:uncharacterized protein (DUF488 family)